MQIEGNNLLLRVTIRHGPGNEKETKFAWMVRKAKGTITPWNFENLVDRTESANRFIKRMTSKDTYIIGEDVLPASSLLYEKFKVLNELNNIKVNKKKLDVEQKQHVYLDLFTTRKNVTKDNLATSLNCDVESITGLSDNEKFNSSLSSYIDLKAILGNAVDDCNKNKDLEKIIEYSTIFEDGNIYKEKLSEISWLTDEQIEKLSNIHFKGWGRLSKKLLTQITNENGERIIDALWNTSNNFIQIISDESIQAKLAEINGEYADKSNLEDILDEAYTSPQNKKAIRQVMKVVEDIEKAMKCKPTSIAIEFTRRKGKSKLTNTRYKKISETYEKITDELISEYELGKLQSKLDSKANNMRDIYYLYFMQLGRDMYTGEKINIDELHQYYDIDHIFPRSFIKDNSLNNRVLTRKEINNNEKADRTAADLYAVKMGDFWRKLRKQGLITEKKYKNLLTRTDSIDKYTKQSFIKRQLVETSQVVKMAANILQDKYSNTKIIEVRARLNSDLRKEYELIKNREVNDYHHAIDGIRMIDLKALMGDSSDNIPGVPGIGEKTAKDLLVRFGTVADIYRDLDALDIKPGVRKKLTEGRGSAQLSFDLATIRPEAPIDFAPKDAIVQPYNRLELYQLFQKLEFVRLIDKYAKSLTGTHIFPL